MWIRICPGCRYRWLPTTGTVCPRCATELSDPYEDENVRFVPSSPEGKIVDPAKPSIEPGTLGSGGWRCPDADLNPELGPTCLDHEACMQGMPCHVVRGTAKMIGTMSDPYEKSNPEYTALQEALETWWTDRSREEMLACIPKAVEYGSTDLAVIGRAQGRLMGRADLSHEEATELGIFFYLMGKIARWEDAIVHGRRVSDDTLHDIAVYTKMMQRTRAVGGWPVAPEEEH